MLNEQLKQIVNILPLIKQLFDHDVFITVMNAEGIIEGYSVPDGVEPALNVGDMFEDPSGAFQEVIRTGMAKHNHLPKEVMGEAFEGMLVPIKDEKDVVGCIVCTYSVDMKEQIFHTAEKFKESVHNINTSIQDVVDGIENLFKMLTDMNNVTNSVENDVHTAVDVVGKISSNASRSNILALNASIEAARSGEYGRGFSVVATEMGKLANDSGSSATEIKSTLNIITSHLVSIVSSIKDANDMAKEHMENINEIQKILKETIVLAEQLESNLNI
ncbi:MAG: hypothetical protein K2I10_07720 [Lachnospiraceae bacterium]|nr:hypothetical protein [Lachnospiraceae bacterium]